MQDVITDASQAVAELREANDKLRAELAEHAAVQAQLRATEAKYRTMFENATDGIFQTSRRPYSPATPPWPASTATTPPKR